MTAPSTARRRARRAARGLVMADRDEADTGARRALAEQAVVGGDHHGHHGVTPERGVVGHEDDRVTPGRHLHRAGDDAL